MSSDNVEIIVGARDDSRSTFDALKRRLDEIGSKKVAATLGINDRAAQAKLDEFRAKADALNAKTIDPNISLKGIMQARSQLYSLVAGVEKLGSSSDTTSSKLDKLKNSLKGAFKDVTPGGVLWGLSPAAIPLLSGVAAGIGAIGVSFGAAAAGAAGFGMVAKSVLTSAGADATKLAALQQKLATDTTAKQKKATEAQIATLEKGWSSGYKSVVTSMGGIQTTWKNVSRQIAVPVLVPWLDAVKKGLGFLKPLLDPIAAVFKSWGESIDKYFSSHKGSAEITKLASAFGKFSASQLRDIGKFVVDFGKGLFNLGKDASGVHLSVIGTDLAKMGKAFLTWSQSKSARDDVHNLLKYLSTNAGTVKSVLGDLAKDLPAMFQGASAAGTLELKALTTFLGWISKLPPSWAKPITELAGAMLLLKKTGVLNVGINLAKTGLAGKIAKALTGSSLFLPVTLTVAAILGLNKIHDKTGGGTLVLPKADDLGINGRWAKDINHWLNVALDGIKTGVASAWDYVRHTDATKLDGIRHDIADKWDSIRHDVASRLDNIRHDEAAKFDAMRHDVASRLDSVRHDIESRFDDIRHDAASRLDTTRHDIASRWDSIRHDVATRVDNIRHDVASKIDGMRHDLSSKFDTIRHDIASAWDTIWNNTVDRVKRGISDVITWIKGIPGRAMAALRGFGTDLYNEGHHVLSELGNGMKSVAGGILSWIGGFVVKVWDKVKKFFGIHSPSTKFYDIGKNLMLGMEKGIKAHAHRAANAAKAASHKISGHFGAGVGQWRGDVIKALEMLGLPSTLSGQVLYQMQTESGGNPNAINLTDSNAAAGDPSRGLLQTIMTTFEAYRSWSLPNNIYNPMANIYAAINYAMHTYGRSLMRGGMGMGSGHGYAGGGITGGLALVGERGRELVRLPQGSTVIPHGTTENMMASSGGGGTLTLEIASGGGSDFDEFMVKMLRKYVRIKGGGNVQTAFGRH